MHLYLFLKVFSTFLLYSPLCVDFCPQELSPEINEMLFLIFFSPSVNGYAVHKIHTLLLFFY